MDSYYLCKMGRENLRQKKVRFIEANKPDDSRVSRLCSHCVCRRRGIVLMPSMRTRNEAAVMHWSRDKNAGKNSKKFTFTMHRRKRLLITYPSMMRTKVWLRQVQPATLWKMSPYQAPNLTEQKNIWNYLSTSVLSNVWNYGIYGRVC